MSDLIDSIQISDDNNQSGLQRIYLYNSFFKGKFTEVECTGNTNNTGSNGAGKTSLLSLIPVFYGAEPNNIVSREAGKLSFVNFYLPYPSSMIVFEYMRYGESKCALLYNNNNSLCYRFIDAKADTQLFSDESISKLKECNDVREWLKTTVSKNYFVSSAISNCIDYRAVIQNSKERLRKLYNVSGSLTSIATKFSLCKQNDEIKHIGALTTVMMRNNRMLAQLKTMLVDCYLEHTISITVPHKENTQKINALKTIVKVRERESQLKKALEFETVLKQQWGRLKSFYLQLVNYNNSNNSILEKAKLEFNTLRNQKQTLSNEFDEKIKELNATLLDLNSKHDGIDRRYNKAMEMKDEWDNKNINDIIAKYENIDDYYDNWKKNQQHYDDLTSSINEIVQNYQAKVNSIKEKSDKQLDKAKAELQEIQDRIDAIDADEQSKKEQCNTKYLRISDDKLNERSNEKQAINDSLLGLMGELKKESSFTDDETLRFNNYERQIEAIDEDLERLDVKINSEREHVSNEERALNEFTQRLQGITDAYNQKMKRADDLFALINPAEGSLQYFLEHNDPLWRDSIGKVLRPELLSEKNLSPSFSDDESLKDSILGLSISLDAIDTPAFMKKVAELEAERNALLIESENLKADITRFTQEHTAKSKSLQTLTVAFEDLKRQASRQRDERKDLRLLLKSEQNKASEAASVRAQKVQDKIAAKRKALGAFDADTKKLLDKLVSAKNNEILEISALYSQKLEPVQEQYDNKLDYCNDIKADLRIRLQDLEKSRDASIKSEGLDPSIIRAARDKAERAKEEYETIFQSITMIEKYKSWKNQEWDHIDEIKDTLSKIDLDLITTDDALKKVKADRNEIINTLFEQIQVLKDKIQYCEDELDKATSAKNQYQSIVDELPADIAPVDVSGFNDAAAISEQLRKARNAAIDATTKISEAIKTVSSVLFDIGTDNMVSQSWSSFMEELDKNSELKPNTDAFYLACVPGLRILLENTIPENLSLILSTINTSGHEYNQFYLTLQTFNNKVSRLSNTFEDKINLDNPFKALNDIKIELRSKVDDHDIWNDLKNFHNVYEEWGRKAAYGEVPTREFVEAFERTTEALKVCNITGSLESLVDLNVSMSENGRMVKIRSDNDLSGISSRGISKLAIIVIFCGLTRYLCKDINVRIHWPLDELGDLYEENVVLLFELMNKYNISLFCAQPNPSATLHKYFDTKNFVDKDEGIKRCIPVSIKESNPMFKKLVTSSANNADEE